MVLYECDTWSLTLQEKQKLGMFENRLLKKMFGCRRDEVKGVGLNNFHSSPSIIRMVKLRRMR
jgi:hypothetical protein